MKPLHTAEEVATFLREEIEKVNKRLVDLDASRSYVMQGFETRVASLQGEARTAEKALWGSTCRDFEVRQKQIEAELYSYRRTLQYLTSELWG